MIFKCKLLDQKEQGEKQGKRRNLGNNTIQGPKKAEKKTKLLSQGI